MRAGFGVYQLCSNPHPVAGLAYRAFQHVPHPKFAPYPFHIDGLALVREGAEHIYWDQGSVLVQLGLLDPETLPVVGVESARKVLDPMFPANMLIQRRNKTTSG